MGVFFQQPDRLPLWLSGCMSLFLLSTTSRAIAQIIPDGTLPTVVIEDGNTRIIEGGTQAGGNLFHSFEAFSLPTGQEAYFNNTPDIQNIISRVTGGTISNLEGTLRANGTANLFLINPNGIIVGPNAQLDIGGSLIGSTANRINFSDGTSFDTNPQTPPLLTINVPIGLQFGENPGSITVRGAGGGNSTSIQVQPGKTLALIGGNLVLTGGSLQAPQGRIELGSVGNNSLVSLAPTPNGFALGYDGTQNFQNMHLSQQTVVNASGSGGGDIQVRGDRVILAGGSQILADTLGNIDGGGIVIAAEQLNIREGAFVSASTFGAGAGGRLTVQASSVEITGTRKLQDILDQLFVDRTISPSELGGGLFSLSFGSGRANDINIETGTLSLLEGAIISTSPFSRGQGGDIVAIASESVELIGSELFTDTFGQGDAGQVIVRTERLMAREGGGIFTSTFGEGRGGDLTVEASESLDLIGTTSDGRFKSGFASNAFMDATEATGNLRIETKRLTIRDGAGIGAATFGAAQGGTLTVEASELVELIGTSADGRELSSLNAQSQGQGAAGDIEIDTRRLVVRDGGLVSTATEEAGRAGRLAVRASESVEVSGTSADGQFPSSLRSDASFDSAPSSFLPPPQSDVLGQAGDLTIETGRLIVRDGAEITVSGEGFGAAGNIRVEADSIQLEGGGKINAATDSGTGGNITLEGDNLRLRGGSTISTNADNADGGNITIDTGTLVALENSDISANARAGVGGRVTVNASGIFGTQFREAQTPESDITATSALGPQFNGLVEVNITNVAPSQGFVDLPENVTDPTELIAIGCAAERQNSFVVTGRGGLPEDPTQMLRGRTVWQDLRLLSGSGGEESETRERQAVTNSQTTSHSPIVEATGWTLNADGQVELIAQGPNVALPKTAECYAPTSR